MPLVGTALPSDHGQETQHSRDEMAIDYLEAASRLEAYFAKPSHERPHDYGIVLAGLCREKREADARVRATHGGENPYR